MIRFAFIFLMSLALSSQAVASVKWDHPGRDSVQKGKLAFEKGDYGTALQIFTPLAEKGDLVAQLNLAKMYRDGKGVSKDYKAAVNWVNLSAAQGNAEAQYHLGVAFSFGLGVVPDYEIALKWYLKSAEQGNAFAQYHLSLLYYFGNGVPEDKKYAYMWANLASLNGFEMAEQLRQVLTEQLTTSQIDEALLLIRKCKEKTLMVVENQTPHQLLSQYK